MTIEQLNKLVDHEIQWLRYYAREDHRQKLTEDSNIYIDLVSIGYTKRVVPLTLRCLPCTITSPNKINSDTDISELVIDNLPRRENFHSPIEAYMMLFPDKRAEIIERLK